MITNANDSKGSVSRSPSLRNSPSYCPHGLVLGSKNPRLQAITSVRRVRLGIRGGTDFLGPRRRCGFRLGFLFGPPSVGLGADCRTHRLQAGRWFSPVSRSIATHEPTMPSADFCAGVKGPRGPFSPVTGTRRRPPEVSSTAFAAHPPDLHPRPLMDEDFAVSCPLVRPGLPDIRFLFVGSRFCSTLLSDPASRRRPCASLTLHLHQVV
jgi:hypothetical protein